MEPEVFCRMCDGPKKHRQIKVIDTTELICTACGNLAATLYGGCQVTSPESTVYHNIQYRTKFRVDNHVFDYAVLGPRIGIGFSNIVGVVEYKSQFFQILIRNQVWDCGWQLCHSGLWHSKYLEELAELMDAAKQFAHTHFIRSDSGFKRVKDKWGPDKEDVLCDHESAG